MTLRLKSYPVTCRALQSHALGFHATRGLEAQTPSSVCLWKPLRGYGKPTHARLRSVPIDAPTCSWPS